MDNLNHKPEKSDGGLLSEFRQVLQLANHKLLSELQLEQAAEVLENVRFENSAASWLDRLPSSGANVTVATVHPECQQVSGSLLTANAAALVLATDTHRIICLNLHIVWISGLQEKVHTGKQNPLDPFVVHLLLQDLVDQQNIETWFLNGGKTFAGRLVRMFRDSVELSVDRNLITLKLDQVVAVRSKI
ncbi:MAG: hypothetical protein WCK30_00480 [Actinomycetes bacterium]